MTSKFEVARWHALSPNLRGAVLMLASSLGFTVMAVLIRDVAATIDPLQMAFFRCTIGWIAILPFVAHVGFSTIRSSLLRLHLSRAALGTIAMFCAYYAIAHMPLADFTALSFTRPLFATVMAVIVLHEVVRWRRWTATIIGFLGVVVMVRPGVAEINPATFVALGESVSLALLIVIVKLMPQTEKTLTMLFWFGAFSIPITLVPAVSGLGMADRDRMALAGRDGALGRRLAMAVHPRLPHRRGVVCGADRLCEIGVRDDHRLSGVRRNPDGLDAARRRHHRRQHLLHHAPRDEARGRQDHDQFAAQVLRTGFAVAAVVSAVSRTTSSFWSSQLRARTR